MLSYGSLFASGFMIAGVLTDPTYCWVGASIILILSVTDANIFRCVPLLFINTLLQAQINSAVCRLSGGLGHAWESAAYLIAVFPLTFVLLSDIRRGGKAGGG